MHPRRSLFPFVVPYSLNIGMSNRHKSHVDACFLFLLRPSPSFPYFSKKSRDFFFMWKTFRLKTLKATTVVTLFWSAIIFAIIHFSFSFRSLLSDFSLYLSVCQLLCLPTVRPICHWWHSTFHSPHYYPTFVTFAALVRNVKVVKLKPVQPAKYSSCVWVTRSKSHWVGQRLGFNPLFL